MAYSDPYSLLRDAVSLGGVFLGVVLGGRLQIELRFHRDYHEETVAAAVRSLRSTLIKVAVAYSLVGFLLFRLWLWRWLGGFFESYLVELSAAAGSGMLLSVMSYSLDRALANFLTVKWYKRARPLIRLLTKLNFLILILINKRIQAIRENQNLAWQHLSGEWSFAALREELGAQIESEAQAVAEKRGRDEATDIDRHRVFVNILGRTVRALFEDCKRTLATHQRNPNLLHADYGSFPGRKFYLLLDHMGPTELRKAMGRPLNRADGWNGRERPRTRGTISDRQDPPTETTRVYDREDARNDVLNGRVPA